MITPMGSAISIEKINTIQSDLGFDVHRPLYDGLSRNLRYFLRTSTSLPA
jgi:hypothetical protein